MVQKIQIGGQLVTIPSQERLRLEQGGTWITPLATEGGGVSARAMAVIDAPVDKVWPVLRDAEKFSLFMPRTKGSRLVSQDSDGKVIELELSMPFPLNNLVSEIRSVVEESDERCARRWSLVKGTYERNNGEWVVAHWSSNRSLVAYWLDAKPRIVIPDIVLRKAQTGALPDVFEAIRKRVRHLESQ